MAIAVALMATACGSPATTPPPATPAPTAGPAPRRDRPGAGEVGRQGPEDGRVHHDRERRRERHDDRARDRDGRAGRGPGPGGRRGRARRRRPRAVDRRAVRDGSRGAGRLGDRRLRHRPALRVPAAPGVREPTSPTARSRSRSATWSRRPTGPRRGPRATGSTPSCSAGTQLESPAWEYTWTRYGAADTEATQTAYRIRHGGGQTTLATPDGEAGGPPPPEATIEGTIEAAVAVHGVGRLGRRRAGSRRASTR